ncbi:hypothetical protein ABFS82_07G079100 [Erythranthe guttata]
MKGFGKVIIVILILLGFTLIEGRTIFPDYGSNQLRHTPMILRVPSPPPPPPQPPAGPHP